MHREVFCSICGEEIPFKNKNLTFDPEPCPKCGSKEQTIKLTVCEHLSVHETAKGKVKDNNFPSKKKVRAEFVTGEDLRKDDNKWVKKDRYWNKDKDLYKEVIIDPDTDEVVHRCEEPLSEHRGHGSAKNKNK